jgi:hypothetical protein
MTTKRCAECKTTWSGLNTPDRCPACGSDIYDIPGVTATGHKANHIGAPAVFKLEEAIRPVCSAFGAYEGVGGCYLVGSALVRPDWRDVDVRLILDDDAFMAEFPDCYSVNHYEHNARWLLLTVSISEYLSLRTGLPIDFQIQPQSVANARHAVSDGHGRSAIGLTMPKKEPADAR